MAATPEARTNWVSAANTRSAVRLIEIAGRLVGEQNARRVGDGARDGDALLLAAGQFRRPMRQPVLQPKIRQQLGGAGVAPRDF